MKEVTHSFLTIILLSLFSHQVLGVDPGNLIEKDFREKTFEHPLREFSVIISDDGYYPNKMLAYVGEKIRFYVTSTSKKGQCFILEKHEVFIAAEKAQVNEMDVVLDNPGRYKFYCPSTKHTGHLTVVEKESIRNNAMRAVASEKSTDKPNYWLPRDYD